MEGVGGLRVDGEITDADGEIAWPGEDGTPTGPAVGALEGASGARPRIHGGGSLGIDGQGADNGRAQSCIDDAPTLPAVGALEDGTARPRLGIGKPRGACVEGGRGQGVGHQGGDEETGEARVDGAPSDAAVGAVEDASAVGACVSGGV